MYTISEVIAALGDCIIIIIIIIISIIITIIIIIIIIITIIIIIGRAEKRFLAFQNKDSFWYLSSIFCKQTLLVAMNRTLNSWNILRRRIRDIKPCILGEVLFWSAEKFTFLSGYLHNDFII